MAPPPLALTGDAPPPVVKKAREPKHTAEAIKAKGQVIDAFVEDNNQLGTAIAQQYLM